MGGRIPLLRESGGMRVLEEKRGSEWLAKKKGEPESVTRAKEQTKLK